MHLGFHEKGKRYAPHLLVCQARLVHLCLRLVQVLLGRQIVPEDRWLQVLLSVPEYQGIRGNQGGPSVPASRDKGDE